MAVAVILCIIMVHIYYTYKHKHNLHIYTNNILAITVILKCKLKKILFK